MIELLVTISIIGILSAIIYANFNDARDQARNNAIKVELKEIKLALELYKSQNGVYPLPADLGIPATRPYCRATSTPRLGRVDLLFSWSEDISGCEDIPIIEGLMPEYLSESPLLTNPVKRSGNPDCNLAYLVSVDQSSYKIMALKCFAGADNQLEGVQKEDEFALCPPGCNNVNVGALTCLLLIALPPFQIGTCQLMKCFIKPYRYTAKEGGVIKLLCTSKNFQLMVLSLLLKKAN